MSCDQFPNAIVYGKLHNETNSCQPQRGDLEFVQPWWSILQWLKYVIFREAKQYPYNATVSRLYLFKTFLSRSFKQSDCSSKTYSTPDLVDSTSRKQELWRCAVRFCGAGWKNVRISKKTTSLIYHTDKLWISVPPRSCPVFFLNDDEERRIEGRSTTMWR